MVKRILTTKGRLSKSPGPRSNRRGLRTTLHRYVVSGACLGLYLLFAVYYLFDTENAGQDDNILYLALGAAITSGLGAWAAPYLPLLMSGSGLKATRRPARPRNR